MISSADRSVAQRFNAASGLFVVAAVFLLLVRPALASPLSLSIAYLALAAVSVAAADRGGRVAALAPVYVLAAGIVAVVFARAIGGVGLPVRAGPVAISLNILAAIAEEAFFRRYLYSRLARWGTAAAVLGSAVSFALIHVPAYGTAALPVDLGAGLMLSWQRWASGRWEIPAATHSFANVVSML